MLCIVLAKVGKAFCQETKKKAGYTQKNPGEKPLK